MGLIGVAALVGCTSAATDRLSDDPNRGGSDSSAVVKSPPTGTVTELDPSSAASSVPGSPGEPIPPRATPSSPPPSSLIATVDGAPAVVEFGVSESFSCLANGVEGQVTIGWSVPSATDVSVLLDGTAPATGIQDDLPYQIPAGPAAGVGSTVVFPCQSADEHTFTVIWALGDTTTTREVTVTRAAGS